MAMTLCVFRCDSIDKGDAKLVRHLFGDKSGKQEDRVQRPTASLTRAKPHWCRKSSFSQCGSDEPRHGNPICARA